MSDLDKPKFKMKKRELLQFNQDCDEACCRCPQYRSGTYGASDRAIFLGEVSAKDLVRHWLDCEVLWDYGYAAELTEEACDVFAAYKAHKAKKLVWKLEVRG